jgi:hypothetical protein
MICYGSLSRFMLYTTSGCLSTSRPRQRFYVQKSLCFIGELLVTCSAAGHSHTTASDDNRCPAIVSYCTVNGFRRILGSR